MRSFITVIDSCVSVFFLRGFWRVEVMFIYFFRGNFIFLSGYYVFILVMFEFVESSYVGDDVL